MVTYLLFYSVIYYIHVLIIFTVGRNGYESEYIYIYIEKSRNCLDENEAITVVRGSKNDDPDLYYCPFEGCEFGEGVLYFSDLYKHIRREHQCMETLPQRQRLAMISKPFHLTTELKQLLDITGKPRDT